MRLGVFITVLAGAAVLATSALAGVRPLRPNDQKLLRRAPTYEEQVAQQVAARLTHLRPAVRCGALGIGANPNILGITLFDAKGPADYFLMLPEMCNDLADFHASPASYDPAACADDACDERVAGAAMALATVSHESYHLLGYKNEAQVECYGMQSIWFVANKLGASLALSQAIATFYATRMYPRRRWQSPTYWSAQCRNGGKYDLRPALARWPS